MNIEALESVILGIRLSDVVNLGDTLSIKNGAISVVAIVLPDMLRVEEVDFDGGSHWRALTELSNRNHHKNPPLLRGAYLEGKMMITIEIAPFLMGKVSPRFRTSLSLNGATQ